MLAHTEPSLAVLEGDQRKVVETIAALLVGVSIETVFDRIIETANQRLTYEVDRSPLQRGRVSILASDLTPTDTLRTLTNFYIDELAHKIVMRIIEEVPPLIRDATGPVNPILVAELPAQERSTLEKSRQFFDSDPKRELTVERFALMCQTLSPTITTWLIELLGFERSRQAITFLPDPTMQNLRASLLLLELTLQSSIKERGIRLKQHLG